MTDHDRMLSVQAHLRAALRQLNRMDRKPIETDYAVAIAQDWARHDLAAMDDQVAYEAAYAERNNTKA